MCGENPEGGLEDPECDTEELEGKIEDPECDIEDRAAELEDPSCDLEDPSCDPGSVCWSLSVGGGRPGPSGRLALSHCHRDLLYCILLNYTVKITVAPCTLLHCNLQLICVLNYTKLLSITLYSTAQYTTVQ